MKHPVKLRQTFQQKPQASSLSHASQVSCGEVNVAQMVDFGPSRPPTDAELWRQSMVRYMMLQRSRKRYRSSNALRSNGSIRGIATFRAAVAIRVNSRQHTALELRISSLQPPFNYVNPSKLSYSQHPGIKKNKSFSIPIELKFQHTPKQGKLGATFETPQISSSHIARASGNNSSRVPGVDQSLPTARHKKELVFKELEQGNWDDPKEAFDKLVNVQKRKGLSSNIRAAMRYNKQREETELGQILKSNSEFNLD